MYLNNSKQIVIKIGSSLLIDDKKNIRKKWLLDFAKDIRELIKNLDYFYQDPLNRYIPIPSAILISNMYAERVPIENIEAYIESTRRWINDLILDLDTLDYGKLLEDKLIKHNKN